MSDEYPFDARAFAGVQLVSNTSANFRPYTTVVKLPGGESVMVLCEWRANHAVVYVVRTPEPRMCLAYFSEIELPQPGRPVTEIPQDWRPIPIGEPGEFLAPKLTPDGWSKALKKAYSAAGTRYEPNLPAKYLKEQESYTLYCDKETWDAVLAASGLPAAKRPETITVELPDGSPILVYCEWRAEHGVVFVLGTPIQGLCEVYFSKIARPKKGEPATAIPSSWLPRPLGVKTGYTVETNSVDVWSPIVRDIFKQAVNDDAPRLPARHL